MMMLRRDGRLENGEFPSATLQIHNQMTEIRTCPTCQRRLYFAPDGRSLLCEYCGHREKAQQQAPELPDVDELIRSAKWVASSARASNVRAHIVRDLLVRGVAAAKQGDREEAFYYLQRVLLTESSDEERARAWLWLSELYEEPVARRKCLQQVLAHHPQNALARRGLAVLDGRLHADDIIDPDKLVQTADAEPQTADAEQFACPRCNGRLNYTPDKEALACDFCDYRQAVASEQIQAQYGLGDFEQDFIATMHTKRGHLSPVQMRTFQCHSCAVEFLLTPETISVICPYCDSVYVTETAENQELLPPQALIPFAVSLEMAQSNLRGWFQQHKISHPRVSPIVGIYLPLWTFDIGGAIKWGGLVQQKRLSGETEWVPRSGDKPIFYDDVLVLATHKLPGSLSRPLLPSYDLSQLVAYDARYLADWPAERYQIALGDAAIQARKQVLAEARRHSIQLTGEAYMRNLQTNTTEMLVESFKQVLLPLWVAHYRLEGKSYDVLVNGQTAEIFGERPLGIVGRLFGWLAGA